MKKLLIIAGAGASMDFEMPGIKDIDNLFTKWAYARFPLKKGGYNSSLYSWSKQQINCHDNKELGFEEYLHALQVVSKTGIGTYFVKGISATITIKQFPVIQSFYGVEKVADSEDFGKLISHLNVQLMKYLRKKCLALRLNKKKELIETQKFFNYLRTKFDLGVLNLNYDNILFESISDLNTSFDNANGSFKLNEIYSAKWNFLYHLHGSVHFDMRDNEKIFWNNDLQSKFGSPATQRRSHSTSESLEHPMSTIITGLDKINQIYRTPFLQFFLQIDKKVFESDAILFIGYGFNDSYLNEIIRIHSEDKSKKRNIVVIDYKEGNLRSLSEGGDEWGKKLLNVSWTPHYQMGNGCTNLNYRPEKVSEYKRTNTFEFSDNPDNPLYVWYSGFLKACRNKEKIMKALEGYFYEPNGCLSSIQY